MTLNWPGCRSYSLIKVFLFVYNLQDDIIDSVEPFADAATLLKERGAYKVYVMVTHGILSGDCVSLIEDSDIDEVINLLMIHIDDI